MPYAPPTSSPKTKTRGSAASASRTPAATAFEKGRAVAIERRPGIDFGQRRIRVDGLPPRRIEHLHAHARRLAGGNAGAGKGRVGPVRGDHRLGLALDQRGDLGLPLVQFALAEDAVGLQALGIPADRIARRPVGVGLALRVARIDGLRVLPRRRRVAAEIEHVVVMGMSAHAHRHQLNQGRPEPGSRPLDRPRDSRGDLVRIRAVDRDAGNAVTRGLVREHAHGRLLAHGRRQRGLVVLEAEHRGKLPCRAQVDRLVPLAERGATFADEGDRHPPRALALKRQGHSGERQRADGERRGRRQDAVAEIADVQILAVHRRARLGHLRRQHHAHRLGRRAHRQRRAEVADDRRDDVAGPAGGRPVLFATPQPDSRGVDRLLSQRAESLALKGRVPEPHFPAREERFQAIVGGTREEHAAQDLAPLTCVQRRLDRRPPQEAVTGVADLLDCLRKALTGDDARGRVAKAGRQEVGETLFERRGEGNAEIVDGLRIEPLSAGRNYGFERRDGRGRGKREAFQRELAEASERGGHHGWLARRPGHARFCAVFTDCRTNASMSAAGRAPLVRATSRPPSNTAMVGIERMRKRSPSSGTASVFTLTTR